MFMKAALFWFGVAFVASSTMASCPIPESALDLPPNQTALPPPNGAPDFVALGVGVQNYTCSNTSTYTNIGAVAELFDISCLIGTPLAPYLSSAVEAVWSESSLTTFELISALHGNPVILGQHYFVTNPVTGSGTSPKFDFTSERFNGVEEAFSVLARSGDLPAPVDPSTNIDWLYLTALDYPGQGELAGEVYRVSTAGGQPPASCTGTESISVKYVAQYFIYGSTLPASA